MEPYVQPPQAAQTNGKSIAAMILGILSVIIPYVGLIIGVVAIVFARISFKEIRLRGEQGRGMAIAGLVCGIVGVVVYAVVIIIVVAVILLAIKENNVTTF